MKTRIILIVLLAFILTALCNLQQINSKKSLGFRKASAHSLNISIYISTKKNGSNKNNKSSKNILRKFPYPYKAMLAISSDIDGTTPEEFQDYHKFLNTKEKTPIGTGVGLDISDSFWLFMANNQKQNIDKKGNGLNHVMTFFKGINDKVKKDADLILHYYKVGWIDSLHTFGDFSRAKETDVQFNRKYAVIGWKTLNAYDIKPTVWIDHGNKANVQNFGTCDLKHPLAYQEGDNPKSPYYHTDLTLKNGIKFIWNSMNQAKFGFDSPLFPIKLRDGKKVWGFYRYTDDLKGNKLDWTWTPRNLHIQITRNRLDQLVQKHQYAIVAQHLGGLNYEPFGYQDIQTLRMLEGYQDIKDKGEILVARTSRLLAYAEAQQFVDYDVINRSGKTLIRIKSIKDPVLGLFKPTLDNVRGLTFYTNNPNKTTVFLNNKPIKEQYLQRNPPDETGKKSISIKWFAPDYTDYTRNL